MMGGPATRELVMRLYDEIDRLRTELSEAGRVSPEFAVGFTPGEVSEQQFFKRYAPQQRYGLRRFFVDNNGL